MIIITLRLFIPYFMGGQEYEAGFQMGVRFPFCVI